jgi:LuxR family maltose regulon positive regulatory protein
MSAGPDAMHIVRTKLHRPPVAADTIRRARLHAIMDRAAELPLTLVSAPAGYGKSTLVCHWAKSRDEPCAWLSLDVEDSDLGVFARYFLEAIRSVVPDACPETRDMIISPNPLRVRVLGASLINELDRLDASVVLVLDDYHRVEPSSDVHELLWLLLERPLPNLRLMLVCRSDPPFPIASLRGRGQAAEIRQQDLRFTTAEIAEYLERSTGLVLSDEARTNLERQTEGWVIAMRLVALHLGQIDDPEAFLRSLHGGIQQIREYLLLEVLERLAPETRDCLLKTAILDRFCPELCEAVCSEADGSGRSSVDGRQIVESFCASSLFVISLDAQGRWFRYHHLFREMLLEQLETRSIADEIAALHLRASQWFEDEGLVTESIEHALAAGHPDRAAEIVERHRIDELDADRWYVVRRWLDMLPEACKRQRASLLLAEAWVLYEQFQLSPIAPILDRVTSLLDDETADPALVGEMHFFRGALRYWEGRGEESRSYIEEAERRLDGRRGLVGGLLGLYDGMSNCMSGHQERAIEALNARVQETGSLEGIHDSRLIAGLFFVRHLSGDLIRADEEARRLQVISRRSGIAYTEAWSWYMQACACLHGHDLAGAVDRFAAAARQRHILHTRAAIDALAGLALSQQLLRQADAAAETVDLLQEFTLELDEPYFLSVANACRARVALLLGEVTAAVRWARSYDEPPVVSELFMWLEVPWITRARALIADGTAEMLKEAIALLAAIRRQSEACRFVNQTIEVAVLQTLALAKRGRTDEALASLSETSSLAARGGWIRPFVEAGPPMADLIGRLPVDDRDAAFVKQIRSATGGAEDEHTSAAGQPRARRAPLDLLTDREREILGLLAQRLQYKEIAARLFISPQTVNSHLKNAYQKLHVHNRRQAVARAAELGLLESD